MEPKAKEIFKQILRTIKKRLKRTPDATDIVRGIFVNFPFKNKTEKYIIEVMKKMKFKKEEIIFDPEYEKLYYKFFIIAKNILKDKSNIKRIKLDIELDD